jgi:hypothetical protein
VGAALGGYHAGREQAPEEPTGGDGELMSLEAVLDAADRVLSLALSLVELAFGWKLSMAQKGFPRPPWWSLWLAGQTRPRF